MAAPMGEVSRTLKDALFETLSSILSPIQGLRISAEQQISILEVTDEFSIHLTELMLDSHAPLEIRQLASVLLKQYVESHWSSLSEKFRPPETTPEAKAAVRALLPAGLQESISKLRNSAAYAISAVAHWDWPEEWPELFEILLQSFVTENNLGVHGSMRVLKEIVHDVSDTQMPQFAPLILPEMLKIFIQDQKYSVRTRGRAVEVFATCAEIIACMIPSKQAAKTLLFPILTPFTEALVSALKVPNGMTSDSGLKKDILHALRILIKFFQRQMTDWMPHILPPVWNSLTESAKKYVQTSVNVSEEANNPVDSDGEVLGFENLVFSIFDFICNIIEACSNRQCITTGMHDLLYYILLFMQITEDQVETWTNNPDQFVEDEDDETFAYSVRISAQDLLMGLAQEFEDETAVALCAAVTRHINDCDKNSNPFWWKIHESCILALGSVKGLIIKQIKDGCLQFDITRFIHDVIVQDLNSIAFPFLNGRCLWFGGRYCSIMDDDLTKRFLQVVVAGLQATQPAVVRISSVRAVWGFCAHLKDSERVHLISPFLSPILDGLISLALSFSSEVLALVLEAVSIVITVDQNFTAQKESQISPLAISVFLKQNSDPVLVRMTEQIFMELSKNPGSMNALQHRLIPTLVSILQAQPLKVPLGLQAASLDIVRTIVYSSHPLSECMITQAFPAAIHCVMNSDDNTILQNGGECLRAYVSVALEQISSWHDGNSQSGLDYILNFLQKVLDPKTPESASAFVGRLISMLIIKAGNIIGDKSKLLLRAVLSKMQIVEALSVNQSLIIAFAHLVNHQIEPVLDFLSGVPGPTGQSALEFVLDIWCQCHALFFGAYEKKVSAFALSLILQYGLKGNDQRLQTIQVRGDQIFNHNDGIRTRSKTLQNPDQWTSIPVFMKIFKLLLNELSHLSDDTNFLEGDDSSDEDFESFKNEGTFDAAFLAEISGNPEGEDDDFDDDPDILNDPVYSINLKAYLSDYLHQLMQLPFYSSFIEHLTPCEKSVANDLGLCVS